MSESAQYQEVIAREQKILEWERELATQYIERISEEQDWPEEDRVEVKMALGLIPHEKKERKT